MKQETIVRQKMWDALENKHDAVFPIEFYTSKDVLKGIGTFDLRNVSINIRFGKIENGFDAYLVSAFMH